MLAKRRTMRANGFVNTPKNSITGIKTYVTESFESGVNEFCWTPDSKGFYFTGVWHGRTHVYRLLLWRKGDVYALLLIAVCWAMQAFCDPEGDTLNRVRYNFMGGVLPFCAGLLYARHGKQLTHGVRMTLMVISVVAVFFFSFNFQTWLWAPLFVCTASIGIVKLLPKTVNEWIAWVGTISAALFVLHPLTRKIFIPISRHGDVYTGLLLYIVASIALAWFYHNFKLRNEDTKH